MAKYVCIKVDLGYCGTIHYFLVLFNWIDAKIPGSSFILPI